MKREKNRFLPLGKSNVPASGSGRVLAAVSWPPFQTRSPTDDRSRRSRSAARKAVFAAFER
jgi:hypothetical protein